MTVLCVAISLEITKTPPARPAIFIAAFMIVLVDVLTHRTAASCAEEVALAITSSRLPDTGGHSIAECIADYHTTCAIICTGLHPTDSDFRVEQGMHREAEQMFNKLVGKHPEDHRYAFLREYHQSAQHMDIVWLLPSKGKGKKVGLQFTGTGSYEKGASKGVEIGLADGRSKGA